MSIEIQCRLICDECGDSEEIKDSKEPKLPPGWKKDYASKILQSEWGHLCPTCYKNIKDDERYEICP